MNLISILKDYSFIWSIFITTIISIIIVKAIKKREIGISIQSQVYNQVLQDLTTLMVEPMFIEEKDRLNFIATKQQVLYKSVNNLRFVGSSDIRNWINNKINSGPSNTKWQIWIKDESIEELVYLIKCDLKLISLRDKFFYWLKRRMHNII